MRKFPGGSFPLHVHGRQGQNLGPLLLPQLGGHDAADSGSDGLAGLVDQDAGIVVELDDAAVGPLPLLRGAHHDGMPHVAAPDLVCCADRCSICGLGAEVSLLLDDDYYAVTCRASVATSSPAFSKLPIPTLAGRLDRRTFTHSTIAAPELSMQLIRD